MTAHRSGIRLRTVPIGGPVRYQFRVRGRLGETLLAAFPELHAQELGSETLLAGQLPDQAALFGVLDRIEALGLELLEVLSAENH
jgi:hypothetical protein